MIRKLNKKQLAKIAENKSEIKKIIEKELYIWTYQMSNNGFDIMELESMYRSSQEELEKHFMENHFIKENMILKRETIIKTALSILIILSAFLSLTENYMMVSFSISILTFSLTFLLLFSDDFRKKEKNEIDEKEFEVH